MDSSTDDGHTPPTVDAEERVTCTGPPTHHTQNGQGEKGRSSARVFIALESTSGELRLRGSGRPTTCGHRTAHGEKGRSSTRVNIRLSTLESCEDVKRLSYDVVKEQRVLKLRPSCLESYVAGMRNRSERMAHSVQGVPTFEADFRRATLDPWATSRSGKRVSLMGDHQESKAQSFWSIPGQEKTPRFLWQ